MSQKENTPRREVLAPKYETLSSKEKKKKRVVGRGGGGLRRGITAYASNIKAFTLHVDIIITIKVTPHLYYITFFYIDIH